VLERALGEDAGLHEAYIPQSPLRKNARQVRLPLDPAEPEQPPLYYHIR